MGGEVAGDGGGGNLRGQRRLKQLPTPATSATFTGWMTTGCGQRARAGRRWDSSGGRGRALAAGAPAAPVSGGGRGGVLAVDGGGRWRRGGGAGAGSEAADGADAGDGGDGWGRTQAS
nr:uncharacterized protein LOC127315906 [Lolium perenne]